MNFDLPDPRGLATELPSEPAPRLARLDGARLLLIDNGKLSPAYASQSTIPGSLFELFSTSNWTTYSRDFLRHGPDDHARLADEIMALSPEAAVLALSDAGVSFLTTLVAIELERRGVPTVILATGLGRPACHAIAQPRVPGLPVVLFDVGRTDSPEKIRSLLETAKAEIEMALTRTPRASAPPISRQGTLSFSPKDEGLSAIHEYQDWLENNELGDGLPLLPPFPHVVEALLATVPFPPSQIIYESAITSGRSLRVYDIAVNAAMTSCPPKAFPVVMAALRAMAHPDYRLGQATLTTHPSGNLVILSGCDPEAFSMSGGPGCLGPGHRGNLSVGRAVSLSAQHLFAARPGAADLTAFGSPAEIAFCTGEHIGDLPWPSLAADMGFDGPAVLVVKAEGPRNVLESVAVTPAGICEALASAATSLCANNAHVPSDLVVFINPHHTRIFTSAGWTKRDLAAALHHRARLPRQSLEGHGMVPIRPAFMDTLTDLPVTRSPEDVHIVMGGAPGAQSMVAVPWGFSRSQWAAVSAR
jgi:hypothetical protein